ncbi:unnamed protein product, partial [Orchesella dallaii]
YMLLQQLAFSISLQYQQQGVKIVSSHQHQDRRRRQQKRRSLTRSGIHNNAEKEGLHKTDGTRKSLVYASKTCNKCVESKVIVSK